MPISKVAFVQVTVVAILIGLAALLMIVATTLWLVGDTREYSQAVTRARLERAVVIDLGALVEDAESGQRGYLLTGDDNYLTPYGKATSALAEQVAKVRAAIDTTPQETALVNRLSVVVTDKFGEMQSTIDRFRAGDYDGSMAILKTDRGRRLMAEIRSILNTLVMDADRHIAASINRQQRGISALRWITLLGALVIFAVVGGCVWTVLRYTRQLVAAQNEVQALNAGLEERVRERTADLGRANEEIQRFAYIVTHDLRAPLVNIMGFTSELESNVKSMQTFIEKTPAQDDDPDAAAAARTAALEDAPEALSFIRSSTRKMDGLINAILKLSREGRRTLKPERIELKTLLENVAASVHHQVAEAGGEVSIIGSVPPLVSDRLALEQIFSNLFDNSVKYRAPGRPLHIRVRARSEAGKNIVVEVEDNGRGIAAQDHDRVFDLFRRSGAQDQPGEGIGLAHVRTMIRNLGGEVSLQSELANGTTFVLRLPRDLRPIIGVAA